MLMTWWSAPTLAAPGNLRPNRRPDKAFTPHLASGANA
ncbi:hypothetical protein AC15_1019 [Escherichia coli 2-156-04_S3_C2]|nr:hypothetical protein AA98_0916 [Escherichia coli 2-011-08_S1_C1]KDW33310.1 hypothetical protein AC15_1019 [Escherichia coli 2-156-04_S3_C2]